MYGPPLSWPHLVLILALNSRVWSVSLCVPSWVDEKATSPVWSSHVPHGCNLPSLQVLFGSYIFIYPAFHAFAKDMSFLACKKVKPVAYYQLVNGLIFTNFTFFFCRYALPLFFLCVRTNFQYIVVAVFIPENEDMDSLEEVLRILKTENPTWNPKNMMVDFSAAEMGAIEACFPGKAQHIYLYLLG